MLLKLIILKEGLADQVGALLLEKIKIKLILLFLNLAPRQMDVIKKGETAT